MSSKKGTNISTQTIVSTNKIRRQSLNLFKLALRRPFSSNSYPSSGITATNSVARVTVRSSSSSAIPHARPHNSLPALAKTMLHNSFTHSPSHSQASFGGANRTTAAATLTGILSPNHRARLQWRNRSTRTRTIPKARSRSLSLSRTLSPRGMLRIARNWLTGATQIKLSPVVPVAA